MGVARAGGKNQAAPMQAASAANSQPLTQKQVLELIAAHVPHPRIAELLRERGVNFQVDDAYISQLRTAGATEPLIVAVRDASTRTAGILVETTPNAQVFVDGNLQGQRRTLTVFWLSAPNWARTR